MIRLYDTASGAKREFTPLKKGEVTVYICGPTVYDLPHLGNARPAVVFGLLVDVLSLRHKVRYIRNITDIDDKIIAAAHKAKMPPAKWAEQMTAEYQKDITALGARSPDLEPKATEHIPHIHRLITALITKGFAYKAQNHIVFDTTAYKGYGGLSNRTQEAMRAGARVEVAKWKTNPQDFVLWKPAKQGEPQWQPPADWGLRGGGRPGWHIECSAMCGELLGDVVDIHGGGIDLLFPHHENEQAQSCAALGTKQLANFWLHNGHVTWDAAKMSKSIGNVVVVRDLLQQYPAEVLRYFLLATHYRRPTDWNEAAVATAKNSLDGWYRILREANLKTPNGTKPTQTNPTQTNPTTAMPLDPQFIKALEEDLNTPKALSILHSLASHPNRLKAAANFLGLLKQDPHQWFKGSEQPTEQTTAIEQLITERTKAKQAGDYQKADQIRTQLETQQGITLEDTPEGTIWRKK